MTIDPTEKDALLHLPEAGRGAVANDGGGRRQFDRIELQSKLFRAPALKFPDLEVVTSSLNFNTLPIQVEVNSFPLTEATVLH